MNTTTNAPRALVFDHISGEIYWSGAEPRSDNEVVWGRVQLDASKGAVAAAIRDGGSPSLPAPPLPTPRGPLSRAQAWLQGWPNERRAWPLVWLGNRLSSLRYWLWRLSR